MHCVIGHVDMEALFVSIERRDNPALGGDPDIVGALPTQGGVVYTDSHEPRKEQTFLHGSKDRVVLRACLRERAVEIAAKHKRTSRRSGW